MLSHSPSHAGPPPHEGREGKELSSTSHQGEGESEALPPCGGGLGGGSRMRRGCQLHQWPDMNPWRFLGFGDLCRRFFRDRPKLVPRQLDSVQEWSFGSWWRNRRKLQKIAGLKRALLE